MPKQMRVVPAMTRLKSICSLKPGAGKIFHRPTDEAAVIRGRVSKNASLRRRFYECKEKLQGYYTGLELPGVRVNLPSPNGRERLEALVVDRIAIWERQGAARK